MIGANFVVKLKENAPNQNYTEYFSVDGAESVQFMFKPHHGETLKPLANIASGGELSRINLAIQMVIAERFQIPTLIFDEIDVGIGGNTATKVGKMLTNLAKNTQLLIITHQAQVAAQACDQFRISKKTVAHETKTMTEKLSADERILEIARMIGGEKIKEATIKAAIELLEGESN